MLHMVGMLPSLRFMDGTHKELRWNLVTQSECRMTEKVTAIWVDNFVDQVYQKTMSVMRPNAVNGHQFVFDGNAPGIGYSIVSRHCLHLIFKDEAPIPATACNLVAQAMVQGSLKEWLQSYVQPSACLLGQPLQSMAWRTSCAVTVHKMYSYPLKLEAQGEEEQRTGRKVHAHDFTPLRLQRVQIASTKGLFHAMLEVYREGGKCSDGMYVIIRADVNIYARVMSYVEQEGLKHIGSRVFLLCGLWHDCKKLMQGAYRFFLGTLFAPLLRLVHGDTFSIPTTPKLAWIMPFISQCVQVWDNGISTTLTDTIAMCIWLCLCLTTLFQWCVSKCLVRSWN